MSDRVSGISKLYLVMWLKILVRIDELRYASHCLQGTVIAFNFLWAIILTIFDEMYYSMRFPARILNLGTLRVFLGWDTLEIQGDPSQKKRHVLCKNKFSCIRRLDSQWNIHEIFIMSTHVPCSWTSGRWLCWNRLWRHHILQCPDIFMSDTIRFSPRFSSCDFLRSFRVIWGQL